MMLKYSGRVSVEQIRHSRTFPGGTKLCVLPSLASIYRQFKFDVDLLDQRISYDKWPHRFPNWIDCWWHHSRSIVFNNCYTVYQQLNGPNTMSATYFRLEIASDLMNVREKPQFRLFDCNDVILIIYECHVMSCHVIDNFRMLC